MTLRPLARRLDTLEGKTVAQLWDYIFRGDEIFPLLEEGLPERYPGVKFIRYDVFGSTHGGDEHRGVAGGNIPLPQHAYLPSWDFPPCRLTRPI